MGSFGRPIGDLCRGSLAECILIWSDGLGGPCGQCPTCGQFFDAHWDMPPDGNPELVIPRH